MLFYNQPRAIGKTTEIINIFLNERSQGIDTKILVPSYSHKRMYRHHFTHKNNKLYENILHVDDYLIQSLRGLDRDNIKFLVDEPFMLNIRQMDILREISVMFNLNYEDIYGFGTKVVA